MMSDSTPNRNAGIRVAMGTLVVALGALASLTIGATASPLAAINLVAHRAVYELKLKDATEKSGITRATGRLVFEMDGDNCVGYTANMRIVTSLTNSNGLVSTIDTRQTAWESPDSKTMQFVSREYLNSSLSSEVKGKAEKGENAKAGTATFDVPEGTFELPASVSFPVEHTKRLVAAASSGEIIERTVVFNGTDFDKVFTAVSFIGKPKDPDDLKLPESLADQSAIHGQRAWPITVTYYEHANSDATGEQEPSYQITFTMFENGISADLVMGYGYASIEGTLSELTLFDPTDCDR